MVRPCSMAWPWSSMRIVCKYLGRKRGWVTGWAQALLIAGLCIFCARPNLQAQATQPMVAIHDSELTRALESRAAAVTTPSGSSFTGFEWWPTNWHYFVMPESVKEALRSDGTAFAVVSDANISAGLLLD